MPIVEGMTIPRLITRRVTVLQPARIARIEYAQPDPVTVARIRDAIVAHKVRLNAKDGAKRQ